MFDFDFLGFFVTFGDWIFGKDEEVKEEAEEEKKLETDEEPTDIRVISDIKQEIVDKFDIALKERDKEKIEFLIEKYKEVLALEDKIRAEINKKESTK